MRKIFTYSILVMAALCAMACRREPMYNMKSDYAIKVYIDTTGTKGDYRAEVIAVNFYNPATNKLVYDTYGSQIISRDSSGYFIGTNLTGLSAGEYKVMVYNFDAARTSVKESDNFTRAYATTSVISRNKDTPIITVPDHLFVYADTCVVVPTIDDDADTYYIVGKAKTICKPWTIEVRGIKNLTSANSITFYISGQCQYYMTGLDYELPNKAILGTNGSVAMDRIPGGKIDTLIRTPFNTFGLSSDADRILVTLTITGPDGSAYSEQADVTKLMHADTTNRIIPLYFDITIKPRQDGGFTPTTTEWNEEINVIDVG